MLYTICTVSMRKMAANEIISNLFFSVSGFLQIPQIYTKVVRKSINCYQLNEKHMSIQIVHSFVA